MCRQIDSPGRASSHTDYHTYKLLALSKSGSFGTWGYIICIMILYLGILKRQNIGTRTENAVTILAQFSRKSAKH
jgi:hypothetical protein